MTQNEKIINFLKTGQKLSKENAAKKFGVVNLRARICELRLDFGLPIVTTTNSRGRTAYALAGM